MNRTKKPYQLPAPLLCTAELVESGIKMETVKKYIDKHEGKLQRYRYLEAMFKGFHDVYRQPEKESWKPDNRLAVNFPRYITETFMGYAYGIPIKKSHPDEAIDEAIRIFEDDNEITDHEYELFRKACIYGHAWEYFYQNEETKTRMTVCSPIELFTVYDDTLRNRALFAVRYGYHETDAGFKGSRYGEILTRDEIITFDGDKITERKINPYGLIPVVEYRLNDERMGLYETVTGLIEAYNHVIGEKANDVEAFAEAYLAVQGAELDEDNVMRIRDERLINIYGTDDAKEVLIQFLQKPTADGTQENLLNRLEDLIYETSMVANISDKSFGSQVSGTALAYKLQAMSNLALGFDRKIEKSLRKRYKIFCSLSTNVPDPDAWRQVEIRTTRNIPRNVLEEAQTAAQLQGMVSKETQLSVLSIVPDVQAEIERLEEEAPEIDLGFTRTEAIGFEVGSDNGEENEDE